MAEFTSWTDNGQRVGIEDLLNLRNGRVPFCHENDEVNEAIRGSQLIFLALEKSGTHQSSAISPIQNPDAPPIDPDHLVRSLYQGTGYQHTIISNPMIPSYGRLIDDLIRPNGVVIAPKSPNADVGALVELYRGWNPEGAIISNYPSRDVEFATLAHDVIFGLQEIALSLLRALADEAGVNNDVVMAIANIDSRLLVAPNLRSPIAVAEQGIMKNLSYFAELAAATKACNNSDITRYLNLATKINKDREVDCVNIMERIMWSLRGKTIAVFGFSCKEGSDNFCDSPSLHVCESLLQIPGTNLRINNPLVKTASIIGANGCLRRGDRVRVIEDRVETCSDAHAICIFHMAQSKIMNFQDAIGTRCMQEIDFSLTSVAAEILIIIRLLQLSVSILMLLVVCQCNCDIHKTLL
ncbi:hypothetical protein CCACVL1_29399 [Corchorus capsularis]|uniref:Uncharacterized protein n=1 Tax=Corchorus capsularis TaxID=210143 RepID=A0A1R3G1V0_COCAP|nr:hypothetical protein CCACVL1_29399 [Corchorus capsularis]